MIVFLFIREEVWGLGGGRDRTLEVGTQKSFRLTFFHLCFSIMLF